MPLTAGKEGIFAGVTEYYALVGPSCKFRLIPDATETVTLVLRSVVMPDAQPIQSRKVPHWLS